MGISRIEELHFGVEDVEECVRFFNDFGLSPAESEHAGALFVTPVGQKLYLRPADDETLPPPLEEGSTIREVIWGVDGDETLQQLGTALGVDREVTTDANGT